MADNYKNRLLSTVSHEFRTPLNANICVVSGVINDPRTPKWIIEECLDIVLKSS